MARLYSGVARIASISSSVICALARWRGWVGAVVSVEFSNCCTTYLTLPLAQRKTHPRVPGVSTWAYDKSRNPPRGTHWPRSVCTRQSHVNQV